MQNNSTRKAFLLLIYLFLGFLVLFGAGWAVFGRSPVDFMILLSGNALLFAISYYSYLLGAKALHHESTHGFLRLVYSSLLLKLFLPCKHGCLPLRLTHAPRWGAGTDPGAAPPAGRHRT